MKTKNKKYAIEEYTSIGVKKKDKKDFEEEATKNGYRHLSHFFSVVVKRLKYYKPELKKIKEESE